MRMDHLKWYIVASIALSSVVSAGVGYFAGNVRGQSYVMRNTEVHDIWEGRPATSRVYFGECFIRNNKHFYCATLRDVSRQTITIPPSTAPGTYTIDIVGLPVR